MADIVQYAGPERGLNYDETVWKFHPNGIFTWADTGSQHIPVNVTGNDKDSITVMASVTLAKTKLPLYILAKGRTERCESSQLRKLVSHQPFHSPTGWITEQTMLRCLHWLHDDIARVHGREQEYDLIMDIYPVPIM
jgi:hypothetical protein